MLGSVATPKPRYSDPTPTTYEEFFTAYYLYIKRLVYKAGIHTDSIEDVAMCIIGKFWEKSVLEDFDPDSTRVYDGVARKTAFKTFLTGFVRIYLRHYHDRQRIQREREFLIFEHMDLEYMHPKDELMSYGVSEIDDRILMLDLIDTIRIHLATLPKDRSACPLPELFEATIIHATRIGKPDIPALAAQFHVSETTIRTRLRALRAEVKQVLCQS